MSYTVGYEDWKSEIGNVNLLQDDTIMTDQLQGFDRYMVKPVAIYEGKAVVAKSVKCENLDFLTTIDHSKIIPYMLLHRKIVVTGKMDSNFEITESTPPTEMESYIFRYAEIS